MPDQMSNMESMQGNYYATSIASTSGTEPTKVKNKLTPVVVILSILTLASLIFGGAATIQNFARQDDIKTLEQQVAELQQSGNDLRTEILNSIPSFLMINEGKCLNCNSEMSYSVDTSFNGNNGEWFAVSQVPDGVVIFSIYWDNLKTSNNYTAIDMANKSGWENFEITNLSGQVTDVKIVRFGQAYGYETLLLLMSDGSIEYMPIYRAIEENTIQSFGKLEGIEDVIKTYQGTSCPNDSPTGCGSEAFAQRADGDFYKLYSVIEEAGGFDEIFNSFKL